MPMIQLEKPALPGAMPVVWPTVLDLSRDECKRILRKLELEAYAGVISALRAQGDLSKEKKDLLGELTKILGISTERHRAEVRRAVNDERLTTIAYHMSGPNSWSEWSIEGRRLVPLMPRLVPQTAFTVSANAVASATANQNATLLLPAHTGNKEVVVCYSYTSTTGTPSSATAGGGLKSPRAPRPPSPSSNVVVLPSGSTVYVKSVSCSDEDEKPRKRRRTNSSSSPPVVLKEVTKVTPPVSKALGSVPVGSSPKMSNIMQSIANSLPPHLSPVKITFTKPTIQTSSSTTQKVIIVTTSPSSSFVPNILSKSHSASSLSKLSSSSGVLTPPTHKQTVVFPASSSPSHSIAVTTVVSSTPSVLMSTVAPSAASAGVKVASSRLPSPKTLVGSPSQILAHLPKQQSPKQLQQSSPVGGAAVSQSQGCPSVSPGSKPTIQIKQESGVKIITQQVTPSKILPKPSSVALSSSSSSPIMVVSSNGAIMTTKLVTPPTASQSTYTRPTVGPNLSARISASGGGATYVKTTSGSIITVVPKSLATLGGKIISSNIVSGTTTKITTIPMTSKPNVIVVQKTTGKGATIQGLPGKNVVTTLLNAGGEKSLQAVPGSKPAIITASRPITKMIVTQPKGLGSTAPSTATKIIPTKIVYGQQGKTQVLIKPKPVFQAVVSEHTRQLVTETLCRSAEAGPSSEEVREEGGAFTEAGLLSEATPTSAQDSQSVVHVLSSREAEWAEQEVSVESSPTIIYQELSSGDTQSAASTIKALLELQQTKVKEKEESRLRQQTIDLSQMAVPLQLGQEKKSSGGAPSSSTSSSSTSSSSTSSSSTSTSTSAADTEAAADTSSTGKGREEEAVPTMKTMMKTALVTTVTKPNASSSSTTSVSTSTSASAVAPVSEGSKGGGGGEVEGESLDPQTGLFYREAPPPPAVPGPAVSDSSNNSSGGGSGVQAPPPPPPLSPSTPPLAKKPPPPRLSSPPSSPSPKPLLLTPQLPRLQHAPTSTHPRPPRSDLSHPPPLQAHPPPPLQQHQPISSQDKATPPPLQLHHPISSQEKTTPPNQTPIITQSASVTKITFGPGQNPGFGQNPGVSAEASAKLLPESSSAVGAGPAGAKSVSDILKISMMEADIDPAEPMVVDSSSDRKSLGQTGRPFISSSHTKGPQYSCLQSLAAQRSKEDMDVIEVIPQFSILPDSSQSSVVVEPSGFLDITNYTSQQLEEDSPMETEADSSNDEATASPSERQL